MGCVLICSSSQQELVKLKATSKEFIAYISEEMWEFHTVNNIIDLNKYLDSKPLLDVVYIDITLKGAIAVAERIRKDNSNAMILLIADETISPIQYMKPSIMAASLLLRPIQEEKMKLSLKEIFQFFAEKNLDENTEDVYIIENREGKVKIPYNRICYFEARDKKIFLCLETKEYGFYETMAKLEETLPDYFIRCHRGFIVNSKKVVKVYLSQNEIELEDEIYIPISRSYRSAVKELK